MLLNMILLDNSVIMSQCSRLGDQGSCLCVVIICLLSGDWVYKNK